jgi:hypothetical protein
VRDPGRRDGNPRPASWRHLSQQFVPSQACVPRSTLRVHDPNLRRPTGRPIPIPRDAHLGPLPDHVSTEADPRPPAQLQAKRGDLSKGAGNGRGQIRRLEHQQLDLGPAGQRRQSVKPLAEDGRGPTRAIARQGRQVQQQQVHRSVLEEHRRHRQRLLESVRRESDQPFESHAPSRRLHRVEAPREVQVGGYPAGGLDLGDGPQPQSGLAARPIPLESRRRSARQSAQTQDGIERAKAGGDRPFICRGRRNLRPAQRPHFVFRSGPRRHRQ